MRRGLLVVCLLAPALLGVGPAHAAPATPPRVFQQFRITDHRIDEASGIAAGIRSPGVVYVQNDSGDRARFFALDSSSGRVVGEYDVPGATAVDWEDIAVAPDTDGTPSVWLADIGDNMSQRSQIQIYRVDEPAVNPSGEAVVTSTARPDVWRLRYPTGPADAESLAVSPRGVPYIVTKSLAGASVVYAAPARPDASTVRTLTRIGSIRFTFTGTPGPFAPLGQLTATGAAMSPDGSRFVVRTYTDAYLWRVHGGDLAAALRTKPTRVGLPRQPQGEGVCLLGNRLLIDSEGADTAVYRIALPKPAPKPSNPPTPPGGSSIAQQPPSTPAADTESTPRNDALTYTLSGIAAATIAALGLLVALRRRRP